MKHFKIKPRSSSMSKGIADHTRALELGGNSDRNSSDVEQSQSFVVLGQRKSRHDGNRP